MAAERDRPFDPRRQPRTDNAAALVSVVVRDLERHEAAHSLRKRKRRPQDRAVYEASVTAVVCDLCHRYLTAEGAAKLAVPLSNQVLGRADRYRSPVLSRTLPSLLDTMAHPEVALLRIERGHEGVFGKGRRTTIEPGEKLLALLNQYEIGLADLKHNRSGEEVIILKEAKAETERGTSKRTLPYEDTPEIEAYRSEVLRLNEWLDNAAIDVDEAQADSKVDPGERHLRRVFNGSFTQGGRLFGGFWQAMKKAERRRGILIEGERIATLDFGQMALRILYGRIGAELPAGDAYLIPGLERHREGVKKLINAALYSEREITRFPPGIAKLFPQGMTGSTAIRQILQHRPEMAPYCFKGVGLGLMFRESEILVDVLLSCSQRGIVALPIHDAIIVRHSDMALARDLMLSTFQDHTGLRGVVTIEEEDA